MSLLYNLLVRALSFFVRIFSFFDGKANKFVQGRVGLFKRLEREFQSNKYPVVWIHCASLGEFEQGRPIIEALKDEFPRLKILLTFFSPSGYEVRKNYGQADYIFYLPWDTRSNAANFIRITKPVMAIFVKYEYWYYFTKELKDRNIPLFSVSSIFRKDQLFFKKYGKFSRSILQNFSFFFVQNDESVRRLNSIGITNCERTGDTRFDRVSQIVKQGVEIPLVKAFKANQKVFVVGSCWPEDLDAIVPLINEDRMKFILAPHQVTDSFIRAIEKSLEVKSIRYSKADQKNVDEYNVLIIDNIGLLSRLYHYGEFAYVGGAFGKGLHNILEAACYGVPIFFGNRNYQKFQEAIDLINRGGAFDISDYTDLKTKYEMLNIPENFLLACEVTRQYVVQNLGATERIMGHCRKVLSAEKTIAG